MSRVLNYYSSFLPHLGGIEQNIYYFAKYSKMQHLVLTDKLLGTKNHERINNIEVYRSPPVTPPTTKSKIRLISHLSRELPREIYKWKMLKKIEYDILHLRGPYLPIDLFYGFDCIFGISFLKKLNAWRVSKNPIVITFHLLLSDMKFVSREAESSFWIANEKTSWKGYEKFLCKHAKEIICVDHYAIERLKQISGGKEIHYIPSGIDLNIFKPMTKTEAIKHLPESIQKSLNHSFNVLFLGRLDPMKGLQFLQDLSEKLPPQIRMVQVGEGKLKTESDKIIKLGKLSNSLVPHIINACDIIFQPVILEGISRISLEGLACGKPVIMLGTHTDRYPIVNGKNGFVVDNVSEAIEIIIELLKSASFYKQISTNALNTSKEFNVELLAKKLDKIYQSTI